MSNLKQQNIKETIDNPIHVGCNFRIAGNKHIFVIREINDEFIRISLKHGKELMDYNLFDAVYNFANNEWIKE